MGVRAQWKVLDFLKAGRHTLRPNDCRDYTNCPAKGRCHFQLLEGLLLGGIH